MNSKKVRKVFMFILMFLFPLLGFYFSPVVIQMATWNGIFAINHIIFFVLFLSAIFLGRSWCAYICPFGAFQDVMAAVVPLGQTNNKFFKVLRIILGAIWLSALLYALVFIGLKTTDLFLTGNNEGETYLGTLMVFLVIMGTITVITFFAGKRALCKYVCPQLVLLQLGVFFKKIMPMPTLKIVFSKKLCSSCGKCNTVCPMGINIQDAGSEEYFNEYDCILCGECVAGCPTGAIKRNFSKSKTI